MSQNIPPTVNLLLSASNISFIKLKEAFFLVEELFLKPYCSVANIQSGPKKCIPSLLINIFGLNLNEISTYGGP